ncbi:MAG TPA: lectin-like protein [Pirellula sp.]|nr:lectin-like protein [Pirellula sp.]
MIRALIALAVIIAPQIAAAGIIVHGPTQWTVSDGGNDHWYQLVMPDNRATSLADGFSWTAANAAAQSTVFLGSVGHLATVTSAAENNFLSGIFSTYLPDFAPGIADSAWIGLTDAINEGVFVWVTGEPFSYTNWASSEPNNLGDEDYVQYWNVPQVGGFTWNDSQNIAANAENGRLVGYIVEFDGPFSNPVPEPTTLIMWAMGMIAFAGHKKRPTKSRG